MIGARFSYETVVSPVISILKEYVLTSVSPLSHMVGQAGNNNACNTSHFGNLCTRRPGVNRNFGDSILNSIRLRSRLHARYRN